ncbi:neck protein [Mycobacterium phage LOCV2]|nr:neck protein [Mycobacterium phage LOCV2]
MSSYTIADEFLVLRDGSAVHYTSAELGATIELTDDEAAPLLADGKLLPLATVTVNGAEAQREIASRPDDSEPGVQLDSEGVADPQPAIEPEPQPRRGRRRSSDTDED